MMKQIIPFQKELLFETKVNEITSISLEHSVNSVLNDTLSGSFLVTGDYKMTEGSINKEDFSFDIPFEIALNNKYDINTVKIDIDNFYYELVNNEILKVNIDVSLAGDEIADSVVLENDNREEEAPFCSEDDFESSVSVVSNKDNIFSNFDMGDTYITYFVYVVKEGDTLESIEKRFNVSKEELEKYNDLSLFKEKCKLVIPSNNE